MDDFSDFYSSRKDRVLRVVGAASGGRDAGIEDAVAEAFARAYAGWSRVSRHPDPTAWVMLTALNIQRSWWRRIRREVLVSTFSDPAPVADRVDVPAAVQSAIAELPRRQREVLAFRLLGDLSPAATAAALRISESTVSVHLSRALATLRARLTPAVDEPAVRVPRDAVDQAARAAGR